MKIRRITRFDYDQIIEMGLAFAKETKLKGWQENEIDPEHVKRVLFSCETSGVSVCAEDSSGQIQGIFLTHRVKDTWIPKILRLQELAWWVKPEYRNSQVGIQLFQEYVRLAEELRQRGEIESYTVGKHRYSPEIVEKIIQGAGFTHLETTYQIGE